MVTLGVIRTRMPFTFEKVDLGCLRMNKSRLLKALAVQGVLKTPKWRMVVEFPFGRRSDIITMGLEKHARHSHGYG